MIISGDCGLIWDNKKDELFWRKWLAKKNFTTLFIDGNHENFELLDSYETVMWNGGKVHIVSESLIHLMRGQVFSINGVTIFTFGGAASHDKEYRTENLNWWAREMPNADEYEEGLKSLEAANWTVDYVITHTCASSALSLLQEKMSLPGVEEDELNRYLEGIKQRLRYKQGYFGHFHKDMRLTGHETLIYDNKDELQ